MMYRKQKILGESFWSEMSSTCLKIIHLIVEGLEVEEMEGSTPKTKEIGIDIYATVHKIDN